MRYQARAPLRIDFGGGWTDVPLFADEEGGAVLNAAITRYARGIIARPEGEGLLRALRSDKSYLSYSVEVPTGAGLGASAAQTVLWLTMVKTTIANVSTRREIAEMACQIGGLLGILGGKQDEYASALGGLTYHTFDRSGVQSERIDLPLSVREQLRSRLVLVYSGEARLSASIHERVWSRYRAGDSAVVGALQRLKMLAGSMRQAVLNQDLDGLGELLSENWRNQKDLDESITNTSLDGIFDLAVANGAIGGKACGAGGGGCLVFLAREGREDRLRWVLEEAGLRVIDFDFDTYGVFLTKA